MSVHHEIKDGVGVLTLNRPNRANAYDRAHLEALLEGFKILEKTTNVVMLCSAGVGAFCAGADLNELAMADPVDARTLLSQAVFQHIATSHSITIAAIQGPAIGGGFEFALSADLRVVGPQARFAFPETTLGIVPAAGGCTHLARHLGHSMAKAVILGGRSIDAAEAVSLGLAMTQADDPRGAAKQLAQSLAQQEPMALRLAKQLIDGESMTDRLAAEREAQAKLYQIRRGAKVKD
jgi:enoyl-CoA hydratase